LAPDTPIEAMAEPLMDILAAQCADLEALLALSRSEAAATERKDFEEVMRVVAERASIGERLESYHRQMAEMRARMGGAADAAIGGPVASRICALIVDIQAQDAKTLPLLTAAHQEAREGIQRIDVGRRGANAYMRDARRGSIACDQRL
jgi:hypothetical protein